MRKNIKLYNVIFPVWLLILFPPVALLVLIANFLIDSLVIILGLKKLNLKVKDNYKNCILKSWILGFCADIVGSLLLFICLFIPLLENVAWNPYTNILTIVAVLLAICLSGYLIYIFNFKVAFQKLKITVLQRKKLALYMVWFTMPYMFLVPTFLIYNFS